VYVKFRKFYNAKCSVLLVKQLYDLLKRVFSCYEGKGIDNVLISFMINIAFWNDSKVTPENMEPGFSECII